MNRTLPMTTIISKGMGKAAKVRLADLYPVAGILSITTYIIVECFLE